MPDWAAAIVSAVVVGTGGYIVRMLVRIAGTLGHIDTSLVSFDSRIKELETIHPRGPLSVESR